MKEVFHGSTRRVGKESNMWEKGRGRERETGKGKGENGDKKIEGREGGRRRRSGRGGLEVCGRRDEEGQYGRYVTGCGRER